MKLITVIFIWICCFLSLFLDGCTKRSRILSQQEDVKEQIEFYKDASQKLLLSEDLVDSSRFQADSGYRMAIMKQSQGWIFASDSLLREAEKLKSRFDSLDTELFLLDH